MRKLLSLVLAFALVFTLAACGNDNSAQEKENENGSIQKDEAEEKIPVTSTADDKVYAENLFTVEEFVFEMFRDEIHNFEVKIRNNTSEKMGTLIFRAQGLDAAGDVLASWNIGSSDGLDAGQAFWFYCSNDVFDGCKTIEEVSKKVDTIRIISVNIVDDEKNWTEYDFKEPYKIKVIDIKPKAN